MSLDLSNFKKDLSELGIELSDQQLNQFVSYYELLVEWNSFMNLTAITEWEEVCKKHFVDCLSITNLIPFDELSKMNCSVIDVGTGAGFPGLVLAIAFPNLQITLLDSLNKRIKFLNEVIEKLALANCTTIHSRAEDQAKPSLLRESFDISVSRAVANLSTLSEYCLPYVKVGGSFISYKSEKIEDELSLAKNAIFLLGGELKEKKSFYLPDTDMYRSIVQIEKKQSTPKKYPRKAGLPSKEPL